MIIHQVYFYFFISTALHVFTVLLAFLYLSLLHFTNGLPGALFYYCGADLFSLCSSFVNAVFKRGVSNKDVLIIISQSLTTRVLIMIIHTF